ncbi:MAG: S8 family serine peptidase [Actinobacteria bacterium]|nr:S8 family serine peptidase [Actinomycetota bacterium]
MTATSRHRRRAALVIAACLPAAMLGALGTPAARADVTTTPAPTSPVTVTYAVGTDTGAPEIRTAVASSEQGAVNLVRTLRSVPGVQAANVTVPMHRLGTTVNTAAIDPSVASQWGLRALSFSRTQAWSRGAKVVVAVVDDGVDRTHPDLAGVVLAGRNIVNPGRPVDPGGHGTHVAGIIAARANNGLGGSGLAPGVHILPVDVFNGESATDATVAAGIVWAAKQPGVRVINMSLGGPESTDVLKKACDYARSRNIVVVAAAGNDGARVPSYPASYPGVVGVGAIDRDLSLASFSSIGPQVDLVAPGVDILSTSCALTYETEATDVCPTNPTTHQVRHIYVRMSGTSMATPFVSASAALVASRFPSWSAARIAAELQATARDLGATGRDELYGYGLVQPLTVLRGVPTAPQGTSITSDPANSAIRVRWRGVARTGSYGVDYWSVAYRSDGGAWSVAKKLSYAGHACVTTVCSLPFTNVRPGHIIQARVVAVERVSHIVGPGSTAGRWHGPDAGNTVDSARALGLVAPGNSASDVIATGSDVDWYVALADGLEVSIDDPAPGHTITVFDASDTTTPLASDDTQNLGSGNPLVIASTGVTTTYLITISGSAAPTTPYRVTVAPLS